MTERDEHGTFVAGLDRWLSRQDNVRNVVRQELVSRQLQHVLPGEPMSVLDVGAGQGTQAIGLARLGHRVLAVEPNEQMRAACGAALASEPAEVGARVEVREGAFGALPDGAYDLVLCHGVLMYLPSATPAVAELAARVAPGGWLSLLTRNAHGTAWRPALRHDWQKASAALDELDAAAEQSRDPLYVNEIGADTRADWVDDLLSLFAAHDLTDRHWYGVRVASDNVGLDADLPDEPAELSALLDVEERLGARDPYRRLATLVHVLGRRG